MFGGAGKCEIDTTGGSGPFTANYTTDATLAGHTIYRPLNVTSQKLPVLIWNNGACLAAGNMFANFLNELSSHGLCRASDATKAIDWVLNNPAARKYGNLDTTKLVMAGQSCGGLEAYSASYMDSRVKMTVLFNSGIIDGSKKLMLKELKAPVAFFLGGKGDIATPNGGSDYDVLNLPTLLATTDIGHLGSYYQKYGGKMGKIAVDFFKWQLKGDQALKSEFCKPSAADSLGKDGWAIKSKNGIC
ncbi:hypothetical protein K402DRAFT_325423 [Aulographum hederae CBS 113979]|uniref:Alpha/beta-hydrolase n=1 Tax=Aulographum hederae CBS 113979 TaxID=1176131 RepID=A0A6G1HAE4_9PEZI|nr:hypothetical protein K402DRAFT_325423 [Aulographum hederae CBS 113979]